MIALTFLFFVLNACSFGQRITDKYGHYTGMAGSQVNITLDITLAGSRVEGVFSFDRGGDSAQKAGSFLVDGRWDGLKKQLIMRETNNPDGASFVLSSDDFVNYRGWWSSGEDAEKFSCELVESYPAGSIQFLTHSKALSHTLFPMLKESPRASYRVVVTEAELGAPAPILDSVNTHMLGLFFNRKPTGEAFDAIIMNESNRYFTQYADQNTDNYSITDKSNTFSWDKHQTVCIFHNAHNIVSFGVKNYAFSGSGKGMIVKKYANVSLRNGALLSLNDLFSDGFEPVLRQLILKGIKMKYLGNVTESLITAGFYHEEINPTDNFYMTAQELVFVYNPYEMATPEKGAIEVAIPLSQMSDFLLLQP